MQKSVNLSVNEHHYDNSYSKVDINDLIKKINNIETFLCDAIRTDTSWHGFYYGSFRYEIKGKKILELGCGDGLNALIMNELGADVTAIDISSKSEMIIQEVNNQIKTNVKTLTGDFSKIEFEPNQFDYIVGKAFLHHLTHEIENLYMQKIVDLLKDGGEARFFEPAINNKFLDDLRWIIPVPGRPSKLNKKVFHEWKENDPHPIRDNSTYHYINLGKQYFYDFEAVMIGSIERFSRLIPNGKFNRKFRRWAHKIEPKLPSWFRYSAARSQLIIFRNPKTK